MLAKINRTNHGVADFEAHAINISGGTMPNIVSEVISDFDNTIGQEILSIVNKNSKILKLLLG
jgi:hypothetical protein